MRLTFNRAGDAWVGTRLRKEEQGIALILVLVVIVILALILSTVIFYSASGARDAKRTNAGQRAYAIAEAGLNNALAQLASHYPNPDYAGDTGSVPGSPWVTGPSAAYSGGTIAWTGTFSGSTWTLTGTGTVKNPTGGANIVRKVSATLPVSIVPAPLGLYGIYSDDPYAPCTDISGSVSVNVPIFSRNCLKVSGGISGSLVPSKDCFKSAADSNYYCPDAKIWDPPPWTGSTTTGTPPVTTGGVSSNSVTVNVLNGISLNGGATVGYKAGAIDHSVKSVSYGSPACCFGAAGGVTSLAENNNPKSSGFLQTLNADTLYAPTPAWQTATCTGTNPFDVSPYTRNNSGGNLFSSSAYNCSITDSNGAVHTIAYNPSSSGCGAITLTGIKCLTVNGSWFIDSSLDVPSQVYYTGKGTLYINGTILFNNGNLCATQDCGSWDPLRDSTQPNLLLVALNATSPTMPAFEMKNSSIYEGNAWAVGNGSADTNPPPTGTPCSSGAAFKSSGSAYIGGSVWTQKGCASLSGGGVLHSATALPAGAPTAEQYDIIGRITNYKGG